MTKTTLRSDLVVNFAGLAVLAGAGIALNFAIIRGWGTDTLGVFNQVLAAYVVAAMVASGGIPVSALRVVAAHRDNKLDVSTASSSAISISCALSAASSLLFFLSADRVANLFDSPGVANGMVLIAPGLFAFSLNKVFIAIINGLEHMRMFAAIQAMRGMFVLGFLGLCYWQQVPGDNLPIVFTLTEGSLLIITGIYLARQMRWWRAPTQQWLRTHLRFGLKSFIGGVMIELNARVDILMLGYAVSDTRVGIYSFAALFAEGFFQLIVVIQNIYQPKLASLLAAKPTPDSLPTVVRSGRRLTYLVMLLAVPIAILGFPIAIAIAGAGVDDSRIPLTILVMGIGLSGGILTFQNILAMANRPGWQTIFMASVLFTNIAANAILIPRYGITGAALATAASFVIGAGLLAVFSWRLLKVRLV